MPRRRKTTTSNREGHLLALRLEAPPPLSTLCLGLVGGSVVSLRFLDEKAPAPEGANSVASKLGALDREVLELATRELQDYLQGRRRHFQTPVNVSTSTEFQQRVWEMLRQVPWGETISYSELARRAGSPHAARAVGGCMRQNPVPLFVPCHRVLASDGTLGGYSAGLERKRALLRLEGVL